MPTVNDPYFTLSDMADDLWNIHQSTLFKDPSTSNRALTLYNLLEDEYLEPARRMKVQENTEKYKKITDSLTQETSEIRKTIQEVKDIADKTEKVIEYMKVVETAIKIGMGLLA